MMMLLQQDIQTRGRPEPPSHPPPLLPSTDTATNRRSMASPPLSSSSSPSHDEFTFTISLHPPLSTKPSAAPPGAPPKTKSSTLEDLTPADDIFFHGHLLPLRLLSHFPDVSPRSSTNSIDSFTLPIQNPEEKLSKPKSFSLFRRPSKPTKPGCEVKDRKDKEKQWRKLKFEVTQIVKRYMRMVRPLFKGGMRKGNEMEFDRKAHSFSGNLNMRSRGSGNNSNNSIRRSSATVGLRGAGEYSAPISSRTSPTNSGLLVAPPLSSSSNFSSPSESTMEELQAAIQAAIAHCKKSIAMEEKSKC